MFADPTSCGKLPPVSYGNRRSKAPGQRYSSSLLVKDSIPESLLRGRNHRKELDMLNYVIHASNHTIAYEPWEKLSTLQEYRRFSPSRRSKEWLMAEA
jgi:hypothetical protein